MTKRAILAVADALERAGEISPEGRCLGPECTRAPELGPYCSAHYRQTLRGGPLKPLRGREDGDQVTFRCPATLKAAAAKDAKRRGVSPTAWWLQAASLYLSKDWE